MAYDILENMVADEANDVEHLNSVITSISKKKLDSADTDDSEEEEDDLVGIVPGPSYMTVKL